MDVPEAANHLEVVAAVVMEVGAAALAQPEVILRRRPRHLDMTASGGL